MKSSPVLIWAVYGTGCPTRQKGTSNHSCPIFGHFVCSFQQWNILAGRRTPWHAWLRASGTQGLMKTNKKDIWYYKIATLLLRRSEWIANAVSSQHAEDCNKELLAKHLKRETEREGFFFLKWIKVEGILLKDLEGSNESMFIKQANGCVSLVPLVIHM